MKQLKHLWFFKIVGVIGVAAAVTGVVLAIVGFGDFESNKFMIGSFMTTCGVLLSALGLSFGFAPEIAKSRAKTIRYIQEENKEDLAAIASNQAEIMSDAIETTASAIANGAKGTIFCKHCGKKIDADSRFCSFCGKEQ